MNDLQLIVRTADRSRKAELMVTPTRTGADIIQAAVENWSLQTENDYAIVNTSKNPPQTLLPAETLFSSGVSSGDVLEIQPLILGGTDHV